MTTRAVARSSAIMVGRVQCWRSLDGFSLSWMCRTGRFYWTPETNFSKKMPYVTRYAFYPTGEVQRQIDAAGNTQIFHFNVAGKSSATSLLQSGEGQHPQCLVSEILYNAEDQIESETAGNGVVSSVDYSPEDGRLLRLFAGVADQKLCRI